MNRSKFIQTHHVIDNNDLGRDVGDPRSYIFKGAQRVVSRGEFVHGRYANGAKWGENPHLSTRFNSIGIDGGCRVRSGPCRPVLADVASACP
jgi:hypothetical protein